jgi:hypothetical protein
METAEKIISYLIIILYELRGEFDHKDASLENCEDILSPFLHEFADKPGPWHNPCR